MASSTFLKLSSRSKKETSPSKKEQNLVEISKDDKIAPNALFPMKPTEVTAFISRMRTIIQEKKCISLVYEPDKGKRCLHWALESIDLAQKAADMYIGWRDDMQEIMELLLQDTYFDTMFIQDFPFYFNLAYYIHKNSSSQLKIPMNLNKFIKICITQISRLPVPSIVEKLSIFIKAGDFVIVFSSGQKNTLFELTAKSFLKVCNEYFRVNSYAKYSHIRLLFASIAIKFFSLCSKTKKTKKLWPKHFIEHYKSNDISHTGINDFQRGLEAMTTILVDQPNLMLSWKDVSCIFTSKVHSITILKNFIAICDDYITRGNGDESFCSDYLKPVTSFYLSKVKKIEQPNSDKNEIINEGLHFLSFLFNLINGHQWSLSNFEIMFQQWVTILVNIIDLSLSNCIQCIDLLVNPVELTLWEGYHECLNRQLENRLKDHCHKMSVENFTAVVNIGSFEKSKIIDTFLGRFPSIMPKNITITEEPFKSLFILASTHLTQPKHQKQLLSFFKVVMECYRKTNQSLEFLTDLFQFDIHPSEIFAAQFCVILKEFITDCKLQKAIHNDIVLIISKLSLTENSFVWMTVNTMIQVVFQSGLQFDHNVLDSLSCFCSPDLNEKHIHSVKIRTIFNIFLIMTEGMKLSSNNFDCLKEYSSVIKPMAKSFQNIWNAFKKIEGINKEPTIAMFKKRVENIPEFLQYVDGALNCFKSFVEDTGRLIKEKNITYDNLDALDTHYEVYEAISQCVSQVFFSEVDVILKKELSDLKKCYDKCVNEIKKLLVRSPKNYPELAKSHVQFVLTKYGIELPPVIDTHLKELLIPSTGHHEIPSTDGSQGYIVYTYHASPTSQLSSLESLKDSLTEFLQPLKESLDILVFIEIKSCQILVKCINYFLDKLSSAHLPGHQHSQTLFTGSKMFTLDCQKKMIQLNDAVQEAETVVISLIKGNVRMEIIADIFDCNDLKSIDLSVENDSLQQYYKLKIGHEIFVNISNSFIALLELLDVYKHIFALQKINTFFGLNKCLNDPIMMKLIEIAKEVDEAQKASEVESPNTHFITSSDACDKISTIKDIFGIEDLIDNPCFNLFSLLQHGCPLYGFAQERGYNLSNGMETFYQEYQLVTADLLHEDHQEELLAVLLGAMQLTSCFFDKSCSLLDLWTSINKISNVSAATAQLKTVNEEIGLIKIWFNRISEGSQEMNENTLQCILHSGSYHFFCDEYHVVVKLQFNPFCENQRDQPFKEWSSNKIEDFIRQLTLINSEIESSDNEVGTNFRWFQQFNIAAMELRDCYSQLQHDGHPLYLKSSSEQYLLYPQYERLQLLKDKVTVCKKQLTKFNDVFLKSRNDLPLLSFVSTQKLKAIYRNLKEEFPDFDDLLKDVGFLFNLDISSCYVIHEELSKYHQADGNTIEESEHPAKIIGHFLSNLVNKPELRPFLSAAVLPQKGAHRKDPITISLISAFDYSNLDLVRLIYWSFDKNFPLFCQLFRCSSNTCKEGIELFFDRINHFPQPKYLVLGINLIRNDLQQVFLQRFSKLKSDAHRNSDHFKTIDIFVIEYSPSLFRHIPWIATTIKVDKDNLPDFTDIYDHLREQKIDKDFKRFQVVYGLPGSGKTHYIKNCLPETATVISINETFNKIEIVECLKKDVTTGLGLFLNINLVWPQKWDREEYKKLFNQLVDDVNWFFFDYFILGYVDVPENTSADSTSPGCLSLPLVAGVSMSVYVEAPYWKIVDDHYATDEECLDQSYEKFKDLFPVFTLLGEKFTPPILFDVHNNPGVQLVCKYIIAYREKRLDHIIKKAKDPPIEINKIMKDISPSECQEILYDTFPMVEVRGKKIMEALYLRYMERRCIFLENCPHLRYNEGYRETIRNSEGRVIGVRNTAKMRSTLFAIMQEEVGNFCKQSMSWSFDVHRQLIYDFNSSGSTFRFLCTHPERLPPDEFSKLQTIGIDIGTLKERLSTQLLHEYLSAALNVDKNRETKEIELIKERKFVLTRDFVQKMLNIHERKECTIPVVIEGETGVGKTFLVELLADLWNESWNQQLKKQRQNMKEFLLKKISLLKARDSTADKLLNVTRSKLQMGCEKVPLNDLQQILRLRDPNTPSKQLFEIVRSKVDSYDLVLSSLVLPSDSTYKNEVVDLLEKMKQVCDVETMAEVLNGILYGCLKSTFYKLSIHTAMKPEEIRKFFHDVSQHAGSLLTRYKDYLKHTKEGASKKNQKPIVTVFLDEINTCSCPGYLKEIITDGTAGIRGKNIPSNIFIVTACNPHRGNSLASIEKKSDENWFRSSYYVQSLPPTLELIMWDYGQLQESHEKEYIKEKFILTYNDLSSLEYTFLTERIAKAQKFIRCCAYKTLVNNKVADDEAKLCSQSTVSQRDIQRVFTFYDWLRNWFKRTTKYGRDDFSVSCRAVFVAMALVYYFRLNEKYRKKFKEEMNERRPVGKQGIPVTFEEALDDEFKWLSEHVDFPVGIAPTDALKENIYAIIVCTMTRIPLIIIGPPGTSKTLSFKIVTSNFQGQLSKWKDDVDILLRLDPHFYQCSRNSTSTEIETVFQRAEHRQKTFDEGSIKSQSVVLMDEAGLAEDSHESLKILHYYLDNPKVSFVGITNKFLDAAKSNRAVCVFRSETFHNDLVQLAKYSLTHGQALKATNMMEEHVIDGFVKVYKRMMTKPELKDFFGLRDFIHFFTYLSQVKSETYIISPEAIVQSLEHNFNGTAHFQEILRIFLEVIGSTPDQMHKRSLVEILQSSLIQKEKDLSAENLTRYKLLVDSSEDLSLVRLLFAFNILNRDETRILSCSKLPGDSESQKLNTTEAIIHSAMQGHTVLIHQADEIQEYFYDLFNHRFTCIKNQSTTSFYANVAVGPNIRPTRVSPLFNCVMIISSSELPKMEKPFLNRFEKYALSHDVLFREVLSSCPKSIESLLKYAKNNIDDFVKSCGESSFYGFVKHTIDSLILSFSKSLLSNDYSLSLCNEDGQHNIDCQCTTSIGIFVKYLVHHFYDCFGMHVELGECSKFSNTVKYLFNAVPIDDTVKEFLSAAKPCDLREHANQAMKFIKERSIVFFIEPVYATIDNFSILMLRELVVVYLHKQLIQLMTPEALVLHSEHLHEYYIQCYLQHQHHFSLGQIIKEENDALGKLTSFPHFKIKKYLCYTRTSYAILEIIHPHYFWQFEITEEERTKMKELFLIDTQLLYTYVITSTTSQQNINHILKQFFDSEQSEVLVLVADMNELSKDCISHVRLLIEEKEARCKVKANKLIYVLLHFSSNMFYTHCYPSIFLNGWQHIYFDTIGEAKADSHINIQKWLTYCLLQQKGSSIEHITSHTEPFFVTKSIMITWLHNLLPNVSISIGIQKTKDIDKLCGNKTIHDCWYQLLFGFNNMISDVIMERFSYFWQQDTTNKLSQQAARYSMKYHSSCTLSNTIKTTVESSFKDVALYLLSIINRTMAIHTILKCKEGSTDCVVSLFCQILSILPIPKSIEEIKLQLHEFNRRHKNCRNDISSPRFPFFISVFQSMEAILNKALNLVISTVTIEDNQLSNSSDPLRLEGVTNTKAKRETDAIINKMKEIFNESILEGDDHYVYVHVAIKFMKEHHTLWDAYFEDALSEQVLSRDMGHFSQQFMNQQLMSIESDDMLEKMACLHYQLRVYSLDSNSLSILRLLDECASKIPDCTVSVDFKLQDDTSIFCLVIDMIYTALISICVLERPSNSISEIKNLLSLYHRMIRLIKLPLQSLEKISFIFKNKLSFISIAFCIYELMSTEENGVFKKSFENFVYELSEKFNLEFFLDTHLKVNILVDTVAGVAFNDNDSLHLLSSKTCPQEFHSILEHTIQHYVQYLHNFISHEEVVWIHKVINLSLSRHKGVVVSSFGQFIVKYHFQCLLVDNVQTATSPTILSEQTHPNPLLLFNDKIRIALNELIASIHEIDKALYSPSFHRNNFKIQKRYQHTLLTEPICDAYFELTLNKLQAREHNLLELVSFYKAICDYQHKMKVLLIEKEAVIHVAIASLTKKLLLDEAERVELAEIDVELNMILNDSNAVSQLNNSINSNAIIFIMRLLQACGSEQIVHTMMVNQFISILNVFECLRPVNTTITQEMSELPSKISSKFFLLFLKNKFHTRYTIFDEVHKSLVKIIRTNAEKGVDKLMATALKCYVKKDINDSLEMMKWTFNMSLFISIYNEVFVIKDMQRRSSVISDVLVRPVSQYVSPRYLRYLQWLAAPHAFKLTPPCAFKIPNASIEKLRYFFIKDELNRTLVHYLLELVAVVLGSPEHSSHLWTHLIMPDKINMSFVPGSLISNTFVPDQQYWQIMSLNNDHLYYTSRHGLNWQSLLLNQWMSYGMLCACITIKPEIIAKIPFLHNTSNIDDCLSKVTVLWNQLQSDCNLTREDRDFLVLLCIQNFYEVLSKNALMESWSKLSREERLSDQTEKPSLLADEPDIIERQYDKQQEYSDEQKSFALCEYERTLHTDVFLPAWKSMKSQKKFENLGNTLGEHMRELSNRVPHLNMQCKKPMESFLLTILSSTNLHNKGCRLFVLYQFILRRSELNIGAEILPVLIEFYNWIHIHLAHKVTIEISKQTTTKHILISVLRQFFPDQYQERLDQLRHIIEQCKIMREIVSNYTVPVIDENTIFYDLLSTKDGQNILFNMITNIVEMYHKFLMDVRKHCSARQHLMEYFSSCDIKIPLSEITKQTCAFGTARRYDSLDDISAIVMKYHSINESAEKWTNTIHDQTILDDCVPETFYLDGIQDAIIQSYIAHKQFIDRESYWKEFVFYKFSPCHQVPQSLLYTSTYGYDETVKQLRECPGLIEENVTELEFDELTFIFHSLNYDSLVCVCGGLCVILKMLLQRVVTDGVEALSSLTVEKFLKKYCNSDKSNILDEVGIMPYSPTNLRTGLEPSQYRHICNMPIKRIVALSDRFREWIRIGFYDFCHLYHTMKIPLDNTDIKELIRKQEDDKVLKGCIHLLFNYEQTFSLETKSDEKMIDLINEERIDSKDKFTLQVLNLPIQSYVDLQIELRKRLMELSTQQEEKQYNESATQRMDDVDMSELPSDSDVPSTDMNKIDDIKNVEENDGKHITCIVPSNDPPLEDIQDDSLAEKASKLSYEQVAEFLERIGLKSSADIVRENKYSGRTIYPAINEDDSLKDLDMTAPIERLRFRVLFKRELSGTISMAANAFPPNKIAEVCHSVNSLKTYAQLFEDRQIDGEMLLQADQSVFDELGINSLRKNALLNKCEERGLKKSSL